MANGIARKRILSIAKESVFGTAPVSPTYSLPLIEWKANEEVTYVKNDASVGSIFNSNDSKMVMKQAKPSFKIKIDEASFPLFLLSFGTVVSTLVTDETTVYQHTFTFTNSNQKVSYTLYLDDTDRGDLAYTGFRIDKLDITFEKGGYVTAEISGVSKYPTSLSVSPSLSDFLEFTSKNCEFKIADSDGSLAVVNLLTASLKHSFNVSGDEDNFYLGNQDGALSQSFNKESEFEHEVGLHFADYTYKDKWSAGTLQKFSAEIVDTNRVVAGSTESTNPSILFTYPSAFLSGWTEDGNNGDVLKQNLTISVLDKIGVSDTPVSIVCKNAVASY